LNVHLRVTFTYNFLANHLDKSCLKWNETALLLYKGRGIRFKASLLKEERFGERSDILYTKHPGQ
ncbi:hypothetical protein, partial [Nostoc sp.]|uniref:hypothetical protein n=1 Tax=Nostoc sp. TaxID=1180 RepID=UPI002FF76B1D